MEAKTCGPRESRTVWGKAELVTQAKHRFPERSQSSLRTMTKQQLCELLGFPWPIRPAPIVPVTENRTCTTNRSRLYPNRYKREELVRMIRQRNPRYTRTVLQQLSFRRLCQLLNLPFVDLRRERQETGDENPRPITQIQRVHTREPTSPREGGLNVCYLRGNKRLQAHQQQVVDRLERYRGVLAIHALGSGKTLTAVVASQCYLDRHPNRKVIVLTPATLIDNFKKEMREFGPGLRHSSRYTIQSYQKFMHDAKEREAHLQFCRDSFLIIDEGHNLRTMPNQTRTRETGIMTKFIQKCAETADRVLILTGTPVVNSTRDIIPLLNMIREDPTEENRLSTRNWKHLRNTPAFWNTYVFRKVHFFQPEQDVHRAMYPGVTYHSINFRMTPSYLEKYRDIEEGTLSEHAVRMFGEASLKPFLNGIRRAINTLDANPEEIAHSPKIQWIRTFLQERRETFPPTVIFSHFLDMGSQAVFQRIPVAWRDKTAFITGTIPKAQRQQIVNRFNQGEIKLLFLSKAGGEGLDLKGVRNIILLEPSWNTSTETQVIGRGVRHGSHTHLPRLQDRHVDVYRLYLLKPTDYVQLRELLAQNAFRNRDGELVSADLMMRLLQKRKDTELNQILRQLRRFSNLLA